MLLDRRSTLSVSNVSCTGVGRAFDKAYCGRPAGYYRNYCLSVRACYLSRGDTRSREGLDTTRLTLEPPCFLH